MVVPTSKGRCCITDPHAYYQDPIATIAKRFEMYREIGVDTLRVEISWRDFLGDEEGTWNDSRLRNYLQEVKRTDFRLKMIVGTIMAPPAKFLERVPEAQIINEDGVYSRNTVSYWYPGLQALLKKQAKRQFDYLKSAGLLDRTDYVIADFGPAGEPIYPAMWTMGGMTDRETFWCYAPNAQKDFRTKMQAKYRSIAKANTAWDSDFKDWAEVSVPKPGTRPGKFWEDVLTWYRDKKREFVVQQIAMFQNLARSYTRGRMKVLMYIPGSDVRQADWDDAVRTGSGNAMVRLMCDSRWLIDTAVKKNCVLQYTGVENRPEITYLKEYLDKSGHKGYPLWGENAGDPVPADNPLALAQIIVDLGLLGLDYTHSHFVFEKDNITPNARFAKLREAYALLRKTQPLT